MLSPSYSHCRGKHKRQRHPIARSTLGHVFRFELLEPRRVLAGFLQGFAFVDANNNNQLDAGETRKDGATIELRSADGTALLASTTTDSDGYYRFDNLATGTYRLREIAAGFVTQGVQIQSTLSSAIAVNANTELLVSLTEPTDPAWQDSDPVTPPNPDPLTAHHLPTPLGVNSAFTLTGTVPPAPLMHSPVWRTQLTRFSFKPF